ncbi:MAG: VPS10 domain-containing protein [Gemmatimonadaceae bacterium]
MLPRHTPAAVTALALLLAAPSALAQRPRSGSTAAARYAIDTAWYAQLRYRHIGPEGNRVSSVAGVPGDPNVYYAGAASGGIFKTVDGGIHWAPIFDSQPVSSVGALAVAPSDPNVVWAGTGEPFIRSNISVGWGIFRSSDAGKTWTKMGLENTGRIGRVVVHPANPDIVYATALGHAYGPQPERGVYRTMDGGKTWERTLFVNDSTGAFDLVLDPNNPRILYASTWQIEIRTWGRWSGGAGSGIWKSTDGGATWRRLTGSGLPTRHVGKIGLAMSKANSNRLYALIETGDGVPLGGQETDRGELFRSEDGGGTWRVISYDQQLMGRTHYYTRMAVMPDNDNEAYFLTAAWAKTLDGGSTISDPPFNETPGFDHHDIWIDPANANRMIVSHDIGISITTNRGKSWLRVQLPIAQMYHVSVDNRIPYWVYGNRQDGPSAMGPSNSKMASFFGDLGIPRGLWSSVGGGESGWAQPDPADSTLIWSSASGFGSVGGIVSRYDTRTKISEQVEIWPEMTIGAPAGDVKYRFVWTFPLTISPHDPGKLYAGSQHVHVTTNGGRKWDVISRDLTRADRARLGFSGGLTGDNIGVEYSGVVFAIAESRRKAGLIYAGTNDGRLHVTQDGGRAWTDLTANLPGAPPWGTISNVEPSRYDGATAYLSIDAHQANSRDPYIYKTTDFGKTWRLIVNGIAKSPLSYIHVVREDPVRRGLLYAGAENALYVSFDGGEHWQPLQNNLPHAPVYWIEVQEHFNDLVVATYGRGFWILDDITPLRQLAADATAKDAHLFAPRFAYRFRPIEAAFAPFEDPVAGQNPPYGAAINYWLRSESKDSVRLEIADGGGRVVRTMKGPAKAGVNRVWWDLLGDRTKEARVRTSPLYSPHITVGADGRPAPAVQRYAVLLAPGTYTVRLTAAGRTESQTIEVRKDPATAGTLEDIRAQIALAEELYSDINAAVDLINSAELVRGQLTTLKSFLAADSAAKDVRDAADSLDKKIVAVEGKLHQMRVTGRGQDLIRWPVQLTEQLIYLAQSVGQSDAAPTTQMREVQAVLKAKLAGVKTDMERVMNQDLAAFQTMLRDRKMQGIISLEP